MSKSKVKSKEVVPVIKDLPALAQQLRDELELKKFILVYAYNGVGKTRLSMEFRDIGRGTEDENRRDTLYFNAFTEDLFTWDNDIENEKERVLKLNRDSHFFDGLRELEMDTRIRKLLNRYVNFDFTIDYDEWKVIFSRNVIIGEGDDIRNSSVDHIKVSRGEENIFIWCFFLAILQLVLDKAEAYNWVKYVYIDDPISSLDEQNAITVATQLAKMLRIDDNTLKTVISTHHTLFFDVLCNELSKARKYFLCQDRVSNCYILKETGKTPFFHHVAALRELYEVALSGQIYTHHFNTLRTIMEKTARFHGLDSFSKCVKQRDDDFEGILHTRIVQILNHGDYSLFEPTEMMEENKKHFCQILQEFITRYPFNPELFNDTTKEEI